MVYLIIYLIVILFMSAVAFFAYRADKQKARNKEWRTKESVLLGLGLFGGAAGALLGMKVFRHKTKHWYFWAVNILALFIHIALAGFIIYMFF